MSFAAVIGIIFISQNNSGGLQVAGRKTSSGKEVTKIPAAKLIAGMTRPIRYIRKKYLKPKFNKIAIDKQISLVMMTGEGDPPGGPFSQSVKVNSKKSDSPYKA